jgi:hypothetical protein
MLKLMKWNEKQMSTLIAASQFMVLWINEADDAAASRLLIGWRKGGGGGGEAKNVIES